MSVLLSGGSLAPLPSTCRVIIKNGTQSKRCEIFLKKIFYLPKVLLEISKKDIIIKERKVKDQIRKIVSQKKHPRKIHEFIQIIQFF